MIDAVAARFGGIVTYAENLVAAWASAYPEDELHVLQEAGTTTWSLPDDVFRHEVAVRRPEVVGRPLAQTRVISSLCRALHPDAVLATLPSPTLVRLSVPLAIVVHDMRHELRPAQFRRGQRAIRKLSYHMAYHQADAVVAVSRRTRDDLTRLHPRLTAATTVVHHGCDHVDAWARGTRHRRAVAFAHHSNKNVRLLFEAWARLRTTLGADVPPLVVVGVSAQERESHATYLRMLGIDDVVDLSPYLSNTAFQELVTGASLIVFPSDFEGFGLPVAEALRLRLPIVIGPEPACLEISGGHATVMTGWRAADLAEAVSRALRRTEAELAAGADHVADMTWRSTAASTRRVVLGLAKRR